MQPIKEYAQKERDVFASNFRRLLKLRGKTQSDVANYFGLRTSTVSDWANARKYPRVDKMQALADYLGVLISDLREDPSAKEEPPAQGGELSAKDIRLIEWFRSLPPEKQKAILVAQDGPVDAAE